MKKVILSTDWSSTYFFFTPITAFIWKKITGYDPVILHLDHSYLTEKGDNPRIIESYNFCLDYAKKMGFETHEIMHTDNRQRETIPQVARKGNYLPF